MIGKTIQVDESRWPLVSVRFVGDLDEGELDRYLAYLDRNLARTSALRTRNAFLFDARQVDRVAPSVRRKQADWIRANTEASRQNCAGFAFVLDSGLTRGLLTAVLWLVPMPAPHIVAATTSEGESWLIEQLAKASVRVPPRPILSAAPSLKGR